MTTATTGAATSTVAATTTTTEPPPLFPCRDLPRFNPDAPEIHATCVAYLLDEVAGGLHDGEYVTFAGSFFDPLDVRRENVFFIVGFPVHPAANVEPRIVSARNADIAFAHLALAEYAETFGITVSVGIGLDYPDGVLEATETGFDPAVGVPEFVFDSHGMSFRDYEDAREAGEQAEGEWKRRFSETADEILASVFVHHFSDDMTTAELEALRQHWSTQADPPIEQYVVIIRSDGSVETP